MFYLRVYLYEDVDTLELEGTEPGFSARAASAPHGRAITPTSSLVFTLSASLFMYSLSILSFLIQHLHT